MPAQIHRWLTLVVEGNATACAPAAAGLHRHSAARVLEASKQGDSVAETNTSRGIDLLRLDTYPNLDPL